MLLYRIALILVSKYSSRIAAINDFFIINHFFL